MNISEINQALTQATQETDGSKAWRILIDLAKAIKAHHNDTYDMAEIKSETLLGQYMEKVKSKVSPHQLTQAEAEKIRISIMNRFFQMEYSQELAANRQPKPESIASDTIEVNGMKIKLMKWEGHGKKRVYLKNQSVANKKLVDCGYVDASGWNDEGGVDNLRFMRRFTTEWQAVIDVATQLLK